MGVALLFKGVSAIMSGPLLSLFFLNFLSLFCAIEILLRKVGRGRASYVKLAPHIKPRVRLSYVKLRSSTYLEALLHTAAASKLRLATYAVLCPL